MKPAGLVAIIGFLLIGVFLASCLGALFLWPIDPPPLVTPTPTP